MSSSFSKGRGGGGGGGVGFDFQGEVDDFTKRYPASILEPTFCTTAHHYNP